MEKGNNGAEGVNMSLDIAIKEICGLNCKQCREKLSALNRKFIEKFGVPLTSHHCPAELLEEIRRIRIEEELTELEGEIFIKTFRETLRKRLHDPGEG
jgi:hypothetical protein